MASVSKIFKPRRGLASTMAGNGKKDIVLQKGEFFLEAPSGGMGTGASKVKVGDGTTAYASLPYALGDTSNDKIDFSSNTSTTVANALTSVATGNTLKTIIGGLKQAISLCNSSITKLNDDCSNIKTYVGEDEKLHFIDKDGADSVLNFSKGADNVSLKIVSGTAKSSPLSIAFKPTCNTSHIIIGGRRYGGVFTTYIRNSSNGIIASTLITATADISGINGANEVNVNRVNCILEKDKTYNLYIPSQGSGYALFAFAIYP